MPCFQGPRLPRDHLLRRHHAPRRYHHPGRPAGCLLRGDRLRSEHSRRCDTREAGKEDPGRQARHGHLPYLQNCHRQPLCGHRGGCVECREKGKRITNTESNPYTNTFKIWISKNKIQNSTEPNEISFLENNNSLVFSHHENDNFTIWHRRMDHLDITNLFHKLPKITNKQKCIICSKAKLRNKPFRDSVNQAKEVLELIHFDLVGPIPESLYGNKYIFTILDDYSKFNWVLFLNNKEIAFNKFEEWYTQTTNIFNRSVKYIKSDNGTEFLSNNFKNFCHNKGIIHLLTVPYTPQ